VAFIRLIGEAEATGELKREYDAAIERAGSVFNILKAMSPRPRVLRAFVALALEIMNGESALSERDRRLLALVVSRTNGCLYSTGVYERELYVLGWKNEGETAAVQALFDFAVTLTREPSSISAGDVEALREHGYSDLSIHDAVQVVALLNYANRIADGLGIEAEPG
jgi:alkylhydroperoxidase family enzyme